MGQEATDQQTVNVTVHLIHGDPYGFVWIMVVAGASALPARSRRHWQPIRWRWSCRADW